MKKFAKLFLSIALVVCITPLVLSVSSENVYAANTDFSSATSINFNGGSIQGKIDGKALFYKFSGSNEFTATVYCKPSGKSKSLKVFDENHNAITSFSTSDNSETNSGMFLVLGGTYYIEVYGGGGDFRLRMQGSYTSGVTYNETQGSRYDTFTNAKEIVPDSNKNYKGQLGINDSQDMFYIKTPTAGVLSVYKMNKDSTSALSGTFYNESKTAIKTFSYNSSNASTQCDVDRGKQYLLISGSNATYTICLKFIPDAPTNFIDAEQKCNSIKLTWDTVPGASGYEITWNGHSRTISGANTNYCEITGLSAASNYSFNIKTRAVVGSYTITGDNATTINTGTAAKQPILGKLKAGKKSFTAKWNSGSNIAGYEVAYDTKASMSSAKIVKATSNSKTVKKLKAKKKYYVKVRSYRNINSKIVYSEWSSKKSVKTK